LRGSAIERDEGTRTQHASETGRPTERSGCRKVLMVGCALICVVVVVLGVLVVSNYDRIRETVGSFASEARETFAHLMAVRNSVAAEFGTSQVNVRISTGTPGTRLVIEMVNPPFSDTEVECPAKPREIARFALSRYPATDDLDGVTVVLTRKQGVGVTISRTQSCEFSVDELGVTAPPG
jgi:hypothetical protein